MESASVDPRPRVNLTTGIRVGDDPRGFLAKRAVAKLDAALLQYWRDLKASRGKAPVSDPRRALGNILGSAVRFGRCEDVLAVGEGIETMLAQRSLLPEMPMAAALSANHLALMLIPATVQRLYIAADNDPTGLAAADCLMHRTDVNAERRLLLPLATDWNDHLVRRGPDAAPAAIAAAPPAASS